MFAPTCSNLFPPVPTSPAGGRAGLLRWSRAGDPRVVAHGGRHLGAADGHQGAGGAGAGRRPRNGDGGGQGDGGTMG